MNFTYVNNFAKATKKNLNLLQGEENDESDSLRRPLKTATNGSAHLMTKTPPPAGGGALCPITGRRQPDIVHSTASLPPLLSPFYDPGLFPPGEGRRTPSASLYAGVGGGGGGDSNAVSPSPSSTIWAPSLASTPEPGRLSTAAAARRRPMGLPLGKPPPPLPPRTDSLSSRSLSRKRRPLSVPAPCHLLAVRGGFPWSNVADP